MSVPIGSQEWDRAAVQNALRSLPPSDARLARRKVVAKMREWTEEQRAQTIECLRVLRDCHADLARQYRSLDLHPRPIVVEAQINYCDHAAAALEHAISVIASVVLISQAGGGD